MRSLILAACAVALATLPAACSSGYRADNEPPPATAPVVKYSSLDSADRALADEYADNYCEEAYGQDAVELDTDREPGGYEVTYACR